MGATSLNAKIRSDWQQVATWLMVLLFIAVNLLAIKGYHFIFTLNNITTIALALSIVVNAIIVSRILSIGTYNRLLFSGLTGGLLLWSIAEVWWGVAGIVGSEIPYPSLADAFWIGGYLLMYIAFALRIRVLPKITSGRQKVGLWMSSILLIGLVVIFLLLPILRDYDPSVLLESILNVLYPLADLVNLLLLLRIFFTYQHGMYGRAWSWLVRGFAFIGFSDLLFTYATMAELYYPNEEANLLSVLGVDVPYTLGYLFLLISFILLRRLQKGLQPVAESNTSIPFMPNTHLLVNTLKDDRVFSVSNNYSSVFPAIDTSGKTIPETLYMLSEDGERIMREMKTVEALTEQTVTLHPPAGPIQAGISGMATYDPQGEYTGVVLLARVHCADDTLDQHLTEYQRGLVEFLSGKTANRQKEEGEAKQFLVAFYRAYFQAYYNRLYAEGGSILVDAFTSTLTHTAKQQGWTVAFTDHTTLDTSALSLAEVRQILPRLRKTAEEFTAKVIDPATAYGITTDTMSRFDQPTLQVATRLQIVTDETQGSRQDARRTTSILSV